ncbi:MAG: response regulator [Alphaproteobacteria bacterium]
MDDRRKSVLIVDDDPLQLRELSDFLATMNVDCLQEQNGYGAVNSIKKNHPDLVLLDIKMPGLDGIEVARLIDNLQPKPSVILMSGHADCVRDANSAGLHVFGIIDKPIPLRALKRFIEQKLTD